jgi:N6-L-threonylcarbamoyladenine synthase
VTHFLGIETSCDETAAAVFTDDLVVRSSVVASQTDLHARFGGVVPEIASRAHLRNLLPVIDEALSRAGIGMKDVGCVAVHHTPGLVGALLVGVTAAKALSLALGVPLVGVNHVAGHVFACRLAAGRDIFPCVGLVVSGGHTALFRCDSPLSLDLLGSTRDDAAGEAFDKVANLLGLGYPGGAAIERLAREGNPDRFRFPRPMLQDLERGGPNRYAFSFSGLKTAVLRAVRASEDLARDRADLARGFQDAVLDVLTAKTAHAVEALGYETAMIGGGVACNRALVARLTERLAGRARVSVASPRLNTDNAAMIGAAGAWRLARGERSGWDLEPRDDLPLPGLVLPSLSDGPQS